MRLLVLLASCLVALAVFSPRPAWAYLDVRNLDQCDAMVRARPRKHDSYRCYWVVAMRFGKIAEARRRLRRLLERRPGEPRALLSLGVLAAQSDHHESEALLAAAADGLRKDGARRPEVYARTTLSHELARKGRHAAARRQLALALEAAVASKDQALVGMVHTWRGHQASEAGDFGEALRWFLRAEAILVPRGPGWMQRRLLWNLGELYRATGRHRAAMRAMRRELALVRKEKIPFEEAWTRFRIAQQAAILVHLDRFSQVRARKLAGAALEAAVASRNRVAEADTRLWLFARGAADPSEAIAHLEKVLAIAARIDDYHDRDTAWRLLAKALHHQSPRNEARAFSLVDRAIRWARRRGNRHKEAQALVDRAYLRWRAGPRARALRESMEALALIERLRGSQSGHMLRARIGSIWAFAYYLFAGRLWAESRGGKERAFVEKAFQVMERLRARSLLESYEAARKTGPPDTLERRHRVVLQRISRLQKGLLDAKLTAAKRRELLARLERAEAQEEEVRDRIARESPTLGSLRALESPTIDDLQARLDEETALLIFQIPPSHREARTLEGAGAWVLCVTKRELHVQRLGSRRRLEDQVSFFPRLLLKGDLSAERTGVRIYKELLRETLARLPRRVVRLVIVPDGVLHRLPFGALRASAERSPLVERWELTRAPSAAVWLRFRRFKSAPAPSALLALADPAALPTRRGAGVAPDWLESIRGVALPRAREEAERAVRYVGRGSRMYMGEAASERRLKGADLRRFGILHLAAHAVVDAQHPERSAVVLASGAPEEDGLLQAREISRLDLRGRLVVLSACRSSLGPLLAGEGVMSLARAFLQAGARTVVGGLWALRDAQTAALVSAFYRHLGRGRTVGEALAAASRERRRAGAAPEGWAGLVAIGDERFALPPRPESGGTAWAAVSSLLGGVALGLWLLNRRRNRRRPGRAVSGTASER